MKKQLLLIFGLLSFFTYGQLPVEEKTGYPDLPTVLNGETVETPIGITYYFREDGEIYSLNNVGVETCVTCEGGSVSDADPQTNLSASAQIGDVAYDTTDNELQVFNGTEFVNPAQSAAQEAQTASVASGSTLGLEQGLLAAQGQVGATVLAVAYTYHQGEAPFTANHTAQITSLAPNNVLFHYASGDDFNNRIIAEGPVSLDYGEVYVVQNVGSGSIITTTGGAYGFSQQKQNNNESPMPLLSYGLSFTDTFLFAFRNSNANEGRVYVVNGPLGSVVDFYDATGAVVLGQEDIKLDPWQFLELQTNGNGEYRLTGSNPIMASINANQDALGFYDSRLVLEVSGLISTWPRSGFLSALYSGITFVEFWTNDGVTGFLNGGLAINPGSPEDIDAALPQGTAANDPDYEKRGFTLFSSSGPVVAYSGADSSGLEATPAQPVSTYSQVIALPLHWRNSGDNGGNGLAIGSLGDCSCTLFEWDGVNRTLNPVTVVSPTGIQTTTINLDRFGFTGNTTANQRFPTAASLSAQGNGGADPNGYDLLGDFNGGLLECDQPVHVVFNSEQNENGGTDHVFRGTSSTDIFDLSVPGIASDDDEQLSFGIIPELLKAEIRTGVDGLKYKRVINNGVETWIRQ